MKYKALNFIVKSLRHRRDISFCDFHDIGIERILKPVL